MTKTTKLLYRGGQFLAILFALALTLVSCDSPVGGGNKSSSSGSGGGNSEYTGKASGLKDSSSNGKHYKGRFIFKDSNELKETLYLFTDDTFYVEEELPSYDIVRPKLKGTYKLTKGNFTNGTIEFTVTHEGDYGDWEDITDYPETNRKYTCQIEKGSFDLNWTSADGVDSYDCTFTGGGDVDYTGESSGGSGDTSAIPTGYYYYWYSESEKLVGGYFYVNGKNVSYYSYNKSSEEFEKSSRTYTISGNKIITPSDEKITYEASKKTLVNYDDTYSDGTHPTFFFSATEPKRDMSDSSGGSGGSPTGVKIPNDVYFPTSDYSDKTVVAVYTSAFDEEQGSLRNVGKYAFIFFSDGEWLSTKKGTQYLGDTSVPINQNWFYGTYTKTGTFSQGKLAIQITKAWMPNPLNKWADYTYSENVTVSSDSFIFKADNDATYSLVKNSDSGNGDSSGSSAPGNQGGSDTPSSSGTVTGIKGGSDIPEGFYVNDSNYQIYYLEVVGTSVHYYNRETPDKEWNKSLTYYILGSDIYTFGGPAFGTYNSSSKTITLTYTGSTQQTLTLYYSSSTPSGASKTKTTASASSASVSIPPLSGKYKIVDDEDGTFAYVDMSSKRLYFMGEDDWQPVSFTYSNGSVTATVEGEPTTLYIRKYNNTIYCFFEKYDRQGGNGLFTTFAADEDDYYTFNRNGTYTAEPYTTSGTQRIYAGHYENTSGKIALNPETNSPNYLLYDGTNIFRLSGTTLESYSGSLPPTD